MKLKKDLLTKTENLPSNLYLSEKVKERRKFLNRTQEEIAEAIGVDVKTYRHWENGKTMPENIASLYKLCTCLDCEIDFLFGKISLPHKADTDIVDYTGLSINAVEELKKIKKVHNDFSPSILSLYSNFIEDKRIPGEILRTAMAYYLDADEELYSIVPLDEIDEIIVKDSHIALDGEALKTFLLFQLQNHIMEFLKKQFL